MANVNPSALVISSGFSEPAGPHFVSTNMNQLHPSAQQCWGSACGPVAILWDIENCPVPSDVRPEDVAGNIRMALQVHPVIKGAVTVFSAYGDFNAFPRRLREGCQRTGVKLIDVPNGRKDAADKAILIDMFLFALDNHPPSSIMLISGDVDFAPALHILGQRGYTVILVIPSNVGVSSALTNAGRFLWDWPSVARGEGFVPPTKALNFHRGGSADIAAYMIGCTLSESMDCQSEEESIIYKGLSQGYYNSKDLSIMSHSVSEYNCTSSVNIPCFPASFRSQSLPAGLNEVSGGSSSCSVRSESNSWVQPGDLNGLKGQLVKLLELSGGSLRLTRIPCEYQKIYGRPLYVSEYGVCKLVNLFKKMSDTMTVEGIGQKKVVYLRNVRAGASSPPVNLARKDAKGKESREDCTLGSSDECSEDEKAIESEGIITEETSLQKGDEGNDGHLFIEQFKRELQEILVSYSCQIFLNCFEAIYQQRYKKPIDYQNFGASKLEELFDKVRDVVALHEEPVSKKKFLTAVGG